MPFDIHSLYAQIFKIWRRRRFEEFRRILQPSLTDTMVDVGGYPWFWTSHPQIVNRIDTLNVHEVEWPKTKDAPSYIRSLVADGCALTIESQSYDIGFSNSVIEHVGSWERQQQFASEIRRVAKALWLQTPAYECPLEPHYLAPGIHYLPAWVQKKVIRWVTVWGWVERPSQAQIDDMVQTTRLLKKAEMQLLFPDCEIITERLLGIIPKSYIAVRRKVSPVAPVSPSAP